MKKRVVSLLIVFSFYISIFNWIYPSAVLYANATASKITTGAELAERALDVVNNYKTLYVMGGWGQPLTDANKQALINRWQYNQEHAPTINAASSDTFAFDCVCLIKGLFWGWDGTLSDANGGAKYGSNNVPDVETNSLINYCKDVSTDFSNVEVGEVMWMDGHVGIYVGEGQVVESTTDFGANRVTLSQVDKNGRRNQNGGSYWRSWESHGKLPWIEYCNHDSYGYYGEGYCKNCNALFNFEATRTTKYVGYYEVTKSGGVYTRPDKPYDDSATGTTKIPKGTVVEVVSSVTNAYKNLWHYINYNGISGYVYSGHLEYDHAVPDALTISGHNYPTGTSKNSHKRWKYDIIRTQGGERDADWILG